MTSKLTTYALAAVLGLLAFIAIVTIASGLGDMYNSTVVSAGLGAILSATLVQGVHQITPTQDSR